MMRSSFLLWLASLYALVLALVALVGWALWVDMDAAQRDFFGAMLRERTTLLAAFALLLPFVLAALLQPWIGAYPRAALRLAEETRVVHTVNPQHRVTVAGPREMRELAAAVAELAQAHAALRVEVQSKVDEANARLEQERNRLAALMSELAQCVLVCNREGRVLLYNPRAAELLGQADAPLGLGRSIFGILDERPIVHAFGKIEHRLAQNAPHPAAHFVTTRRHQLLRAQMAPVLDANGGVDGFVLVLEDITRAVETDSRRVYLLQQLTEGSRASLANIRAAAETVQQYPDMEPERRQRFIAVIGEEAQKLSAQLDDTLGRERDTPREHWPLEDMQASDLVHALQRNLQAGLGVSARYEASDEPCWLSVDSYSMVQGLTHLTGLLVAGFGIRELAIELIHAGRFARLSLLWDGPSLDPSLLRQWAEQPFATGSEGDVLTLQRVLEQHGGEMWCLGDRSSGINRLSLQLPSAQHDAAPAVPAARSRPVYYDFDLFNQPGQGPQTDERLLSELSFTVFDTETTGLSPSDGDEIVSIGAVRIVNGRLLKQECFDRLVKPRRPVSRESRQVHGITSAMLADQAPIEEVLPAFHRFAEDTVLVAHNAAFDMRFLQIAQRQAGVQFTQPVLDTLLLSALVHPGHPDTEHRLEQIALRLGVAVAGRHTALGDAIVTGEVFLRLVPLLAQRGIRTLKQAREASRKTPYAKLAY